MATNEEFAQNFYTTLKSSVQTPAIRLQLKPIFIFPILSL